MATKRALDSLLGQHADTVEQAQNNNEKAVNELNKTMSGIKRRKKTLTVWAKKERTKYIQTIDSKTNEAIARINDTEKFYSELMILRAPAKYWDDKADTHTRSANRYKTYLVCFSALAFIILFCAVFNLFGDLVGDAKTIDNTALATALFLLISTSVIWVSRIMVRLYLSEHHLSIDAKQRHTMAMTYLSLIKENAADASQREQVIEALFRPTSDGLVKDDALPGWLMSKHFTS